MAAVISVALYTSYVSLSNASIARTARVSTLITSSPTVCSTLHSGFIVFVKLLIESARVILIPWVNLTSSVTLVISFVKRSNASKCVLTAFIYCSPPDNAFVTHAWLYCTSKFFMIASISGLYIDKLSRFSLIIVYISSNAEKPASCASLLSASTPPSRIARAYLLSTPEAYPSADVRIVYIP